MSANFFHTVTENTDVQTDHSREKEDLWELFLNYSLSVRFSLCFLQLV